MVLNELNLKNFLSQYNIIDWNEKIKITKIVSRNNCFFVKLLSGEKYFIKQSLEINELNKEGLYKEVLFYSWIVLKKIEFKSNLVNYIGFEKYNNVAIFNAISQKAKLKSNAHSKLKKITKMILELNKVKFDNTFPIILKNKPDIYKYIFEINVENNLAKDWKTFQTKIRSSKILISYFIQLLNIWVPNKLCHNDIKWDNFIQESKTNKLFWIDWERICLADEYWDIANFLRLITWRVIIVDSSYGAIFTNKVFLIEIKLILKTANSVFLKLNLNKMILLWIGALLDKTFELLQEGTISITKANEILILCENMYLKRERIENYFF